MSSAAIFTEEALIGKVLGRVRLDAIVGQGTSGVVYRGYHTTLGIDVAVKILKLSAGEQVPRYRDRFRREAQLTARLDHPGIVRVIDYGEEQGVLFLVMDFVEGYSLETYLKQRPAAMAEKTMLKILLSLTQALAAAHQAGVIHRDLKPANIMLTRQGRLRLTDLGLAYQVDGLAGMTRGEQAVGTPYYMPPESFTAGKQVDERSDLYALGVIGYRLAYGELPYTGNLQQVYAGHMRGQASWGSLTNCHPDTIAILKKLMSRKPEHRFGTAAELVQALRRRLQQRKGADPAASATGSHSGSASEFHAFSSFVEQRLGTNSSEYYGGRVTHTTTRERIIVWLLLILLIAGLAVGYFVVTASDNAESTDTPATENSVD